MTRGRRRPRYRFNGLQLGGSPAEVVEALRQQWWFKVTPEEMFLFASSLAKMPVKNAEEFIALLLAAGILKEEAQ